MLRLGLLTGLTTVLALAAACKGQPVQPVQPDLPVKTGSPAGGPATCGAGVLDPAAVKPGVWYKRTPIPGAPLNPRMGYEGAWDWDPYSKLILRWGGHNQGGGGEQNSEMWAYDPKANTFTLMEPNYSPPGACCCRDNVFDVANRRYVRFPAFSASHGWQWRREVAQMQSSVWTYDHASNQWRNMRPLPEPSVRPLRGAAYDPNDQVIVVAQGEEVKWGTAVYDLHANTWTMMNARNEPPERNDFGMAYDPVGRKFVTFGSQSGSDPRTWIYDLRKNEWQGLELSPHPPAVKNGAVLAYDSLNKIMLCVALTWTRGIDPEDGSPGNIPGSLETWAFDPAKLVWKKLDTPEAPEPTGVRNRMLVFVPDLNVFVLENRTGNTHFPDGKKQTQEQQEWIFRYADYTPPKDAAQPAPLDLKAVAEANAVTLSWRVANPETVKGCAIYRGTADGEKPWLADYKRVHVINVDSQTYSFKDPNVKPGQVCFYYVTAYGADRKEGPPSLKVRTQPPVVVDVVVSVADTKKVELSWDKQADDVAGYNVYRAPVQVLSTDQYRPVRDRHPLTSPLAEPFLGAVQKVGQFVKLTEKPIADTAFTDAGVDLTGPNTGLVAPTTRPDQNVNPDGKPYRWGVFAYRVSAVNKLGVESGPSPYYLTVPGPVSDLKSRERPGETDLRWTANREKGVQGYRVYRMEERGTAENRFAAKMTLLTAELVKGTSFTDKIANGPEDDAKRYYVVAVDALGQEGIVGSPTWGAREYAKYYKGFLAEWHQ